MCLLFVCVCLIGACVRVRFFYCTGVFVWLVYDMVCDDVSSLLVVLCVFYSCVVV